MLLPVVVSYFLHSDCSSTHTLASPSFVFFPHCTTQWRLCLSTMAPSTRRWERRSFVRRRKMAAIWYVRVSPWLGLTAYVFCKYLLQIRFWESMCINVSRTLLFCLVVFILCTNVAAKADFWWKSNVYLFFILKCIRSDFIMLPFHYDLKITEFWSWILQLTLENVNIQPTETSPWSYILKPQFLFLFLYKYFIALLMFYLKYFTETAKEHGLHLTWI